MKGLFFTHLTAQPLAAQLRKVFQANFTTVTPVIAAVNNFKMRLLAMKKKNGQRLHHFLQQMEGNDSFSEIIIVNGGVEEII